MPGPLPQPQRRRRNAPTIPTTELPAAGRKGAPPRPPKSVTLATAGAAWWRWAWHTPQAAAWSPGDVYVIARRACLEDDLAALADIEAIDWSTLADADWQDPETAHEQLLMLRSMVSGLASLAAGKLAILREARELDDRLGLTPKAMAQLRWRIIDEEAQQAPPAVATAPPTEPGRAG